jgi:hypothetical protein
MPKIIYYWPKLLTSIILSFEISSILFKLKENSLSSEQSKAKDIPDLRNPLIIVSFLR